MTQWISRELEAGLDLTSFDCGKEVLNKWLYENSHRAQEAGTARTYVWTEEDQHVVKAYYSLAPVSVTKEGLTRAQTGGFSVIPGYLIGKLALDQTLKGQGLGAELLFDAIDKIVRASASGGGRLIVVDALDEEAAKFYLHHDFVPVKGNPSRLVMTIATARMALGVGTITLTGDKTSRLISMVFETPEGNTIPVVLSAAELAATASTLDAMPDEELTAEALREAIVRAIGRDPFEEA